MLHNKEEKQQRESLRASDSGGRSRAGVACATAWICEMAADISESSGADCKGDPRNSAKLDADYPLRVLYCGKIHPNKKLELVRVKEQQGKKKRRKKQKRGGRGQIKQKKKTVPQKVTIAKIPRAKKKYVTRVCGLATFEIDLKEAQRFFAQKFSCGASVTGEDEIIIQGDFTGGIIDAIKKKMAR
ncbi:hypothetical protein P7K49_022577, partial [Saguinus oedipus]